MFLSQIFATTTVASVPGNIQPLALIGFAAIFLNEHITRWKVFALLLGLIGFVLIGFVRLVSTDRMPYLEQRWLFSPR